ncbi:hypothetical protein D3C71_1709030 [compost metagenome]
MVSTSAFAHADTVLISLIAVPGFVAGIDNALTIMAAICSRVILSFGLNSLLNPVINPAL